MPIATIPSSLPFADTLATTILGRYGENPILLTQILLLLPNRRSCRTVQEAFLRKSKNNALLLPNIQPIGDVDEESLSFTMFLESETPVIPQAISPLEQQYILTKLIQHWSKHNSEIKLNTSLDYSFKMAKELSSLLQEFEKENIPIEQLNHLVPEEYAKHWQSILSFLNIIIEFWPSILEERNCISHTKHRNDTIEKLCKYWQKNPPNFPIIAAGTTGSIPIVRELLSTINMFEEGWVLLPGLDLTMNSKDWEYIDPPHPQYGLKKLLESLNIERNSVSLWADIPNDLQETAKKNPLTPFLSEVMRPAPTSNEWVKLQKKNQDNHRLKTSLANLSRIDAKHQHEEAMIIAMHMRMAIEDTDKTAMLVTPDRNLARRVKANLQKWNITIDDSAGIPLSSTKEAIFLRLLIDCIKENYAPVSFLSLLKHPLSRFGYTKETLDTEISNLERLVFRNDIFFDGIDSIYQNAPNKEFIHNIKICLEPLEKLIKTPVASFHDILQLHIKTAENIASTDSLPGKDRLWSTHEGETLINTFKEWLLASLQLGEIAAKEYPHFFVTLLNQTTFRPRHNTHPRLHIFSPMEARLQHTDITILGSLNEGTWPETHAIDPWLSRAMREKLGLPPQEQKIGLMAHDFIQLCHADEVILTRSNKVDGKPTLPSRWLLRLDAVLKALKLNQYIIPKYPWQEWAEALSTVNMDSCNISRESNVENDLALPPIEARPRQFSITHIESLMRDPYSIYAAKILDLKPLQTIDQDPTLADFGQFIHESLEEYNNHYQNIPTNKRLEILLSIGEKNLTSVKEHPAIFAFWWPRFERVAKWFVEYDTKRRDNLNISIHAEKQGHYEIPSTRGNIEIIGRADRLEIDRKNNLYLIDYKTASAPTTKDVRLGISPQLALQALLFEKEGTISELSYWKLSGGKNPVEIVTIPEPSLRVEQAKEGLIKLFMHFDDPTTSYLSEPNPQQKPRFNDYRHLARKAAAP